MEQRYLAYGGFVLIAFVVLASAFYYFTGSASPTGNVALVSCSDTDGGLDYRLFGTVTAYPIGKAIKYTDKCKDDYTVIEYSCKNVKGKMQAVSTEKDCLSVSSKYCKNGACQG